MHACMHDRLDLPNPDPGPLFPCRRQFQLKAQAGTAAGRILGCLPVVLPAPSQSGVIRHSLWPAFIPFPYLGGLTSMSAPHRPAPFPPSVCLHACLLAAVSWVMCAPPFIYLFICFSNVIFLEEIALASFPTLTPEFCWGRVTLTV